MDNKILEKKYQNKTIILNFQKNNKLLTKKPLFKESLKSGFETLKSRKLVSF